MSSTILYINPDGLARNPAFSQAVITQGSGKTIYVGGQNALNAKGELIGKDNLGAQTEQALHNLQVALEACGASFDNLVKLTMYFVQGQNLQEAFQVSQKFMRTAKNQPAVSGLFVSGLANPAKSNTLFSKLLSPFYF